MQRVLVAGVGLGTHGLSRWSYYSGNSLRVGYVSEVSMPEKGQYEVTAGAVLVTGDLDGQGGAEIFVGDPTGEGLGWVIGELGY